MIDEPFINFVVWQTTKSNDDDIMQVAREAWWKAKEKFGIHKPYTEFCAYATPRIKHAIIDYKRSQTPTGINSRTEKGKKQLRVFTQVDIEEMELPIDPQYDEMVYLHQVIDRSKDLSKKHCKVIEMHATGHTLAEIGARVGVTEGRACQMVKEARDFIR